MELDIDLDINNVKNKYLQLNIRTTLLLSYILIILLSIGLISIIMNFFIEEYFKDYVIKNQKKYNDEIIKSIIYNCKIAKKLDHDSIEDVGVRALELGKIVKVYNEDGDIIWDATKHNNGMCKRIIEKMSTSMDKHFPSINGKYNEEPYDLKINKDITGKIVIGSYGPFYLNDNDIYFINTLNRILIVVIVTSIVLAVIVGSYLAKGISSPIGKVTKVVKHISEGAYDKRINGTSRTKEIIQLTESINNLAWKLEEQEKLRKRLTADVAHELRTPLATLQSHMEAMIDGIWESDEKRLKSCHFEIKRITGLVENMEKLAYYEKEALKLDYTTFNLLDIVKETVKNIELGNIDSNKKINISILGENIDIKADKEKIVQVLINTLSNSVKYSGKNLNINVNIENLAGKIKLSIEDDGFGIPKKDLNYVFERFYRVDEARSQMSGGSGIGLAIVKAIIEAHKGLIDIESELTKGTKINIVLSK
jgi:two-component system, OmpR family, sensor histidine kinase BaeS